MPRPHDKIIAPLLLSLTTLLFAAVWSGDTQGFPPPRCAVTKAAPAPHARQQCAQIAAGVAAAAYVPGDEAASAVAATADEPADGVSAGIASEPTAEWVAQLVRRLTLSTR